ncbi:unnamed protein product [Adineta ricciae]|uniref:Speriolin C-terminal domain-containing protein n=1 Tax=Adineta ricciae TaxID=249248 RepID=A0A813WGY4_ADIRI|nr:unnamed protein product [Adineta ricciae]CAF1666326.1 unnamed protein product [Adineta ricciae]
MKFNFESTRSSIKSQSNEKTFVCQRYATRHQITNTSKAVRRKLIQETNINTTIIDVIERSPSACPLTEQPFHERIDKYLQKDNSILPISSETKQNLNRLQRITDDVKLITKQLQSSLQVNQNVNSTNDILDQRLLGEICYQLERRILVLIFSQSKQLYGYSLRYVPSIINTEPNAHDRSIYKKRLDNIQKYLSKENFSLHHHSILTFNFINKYGIYPDYQWLQSSSNLFTNVDEMKTFCSKFLSKEYHVDLSIIINSLDLISQCDGKPLFYW